MTESIPAVSASVTPVSQLRTFLKNEVVSRKESERDDNNSNSNSNSNNNNNNNNEGGSTYFYGDCGFGKIKLVDAVGILLDADERRVSLVSLSNCERFSASTTTVDFVTFPQTASCHA
jgi:predicted ATPase